ncbi:hypothetical protein TrST_g6322 [Triparma strigata]|uniref:Uncharacterized protein n=1 Tax=Triparma strigata TaxID=1606541 RepID=A0A9W7BX83_9STRA|nr:hypothetical protein TrST_g6322 [Triparma strigata]
MAALGFITESSKIVYDQEVELLSPDHQDHSFCGIMFDISCNEESALTHLYITSLSVRGGLGDVSVYYSKEEVRHNSVYNKAGRWNCCFSDPQLPSSWRNYTELTFTEPVEIKKGQTRAFYVHSKTPGDSSIVYDNNRRYATSQDDFISILPGKAHLGIIPFSDESQFGWGAWRNNREFVGRVGYGTRMILWRKQVHGEFPPGWQSCASAFFMMHACSWSGLPADVVCYILNFCGWEWFAVEYGGGKKPRRISENFKSGVKQLLRLRSSRSSRDDNDADADEEVEGEGVDGDEESTSSFSAGRTHRNSFSCIIT